MNRVGLGLAAGAGYVLGRTKKMKLAFAVGTLVAGKRMQLSPRALDAVADRLHGRTAQVRDQPAGVVPGTEDLGPDDEEEPRRKAATKAPAKKAAAKKAPAKKTAAKKTANRKPAAKKTAAARGAARSARSRLPKGGEER
jgi:hypothetical protein